LAFDNSDIEASDAPNDDDDGEELDGFDVIVVVVVEEGNIAGIGEGSNA
jgi:hypothetical protein